MKKMQGVLTGRVFLSSVQAKKLWFSLDEHEKVAESMSAKESGVIARRILKSTEQWLSENYER